MPSRASAIGPDCLPYVSGDRPITHTIQDKWVLHQSGYEVTRDVQTQAEKTQENPFYLIFSPGVTGSRVESRCLSTVKLFSCEGFPSVGTSRDGPSFAHHVAHYTASPGAVTSIMTKLAPAATIMWGSVILLKTKHLQRKPHDLDSPRQ